MQHKQLEEVLISLRKIIRATDIHSRNLIKSTGLTAPQLLLLRTIREQGRCSISQLARRMSLSQATVTLIIDRLESRDYLFRSRSSHDKRRVEVILTEKGEDISRRAPPPLQASFAREFENLESWERYMILSALQRVAHMMQADDIDASPVLDVGNLDRSSEGE